MKKREYCKEHDYTLVLVPYWDEGRLNYDYLMTAAGYQPKIKRKVGSHFDKPKRKIRTNP